jgi:hypothetical protein
MVNVIDSNKDNMIDSDEIEISERILELELREEKHKTQQKMAWSAIISMIIFVIIILSPIISVEKLEALSDLFGLYFISVSGIVAAYFGSSAWMSNNAINNSGYETLTYHKLGKYSGSKRIPTSY